MSESMAVIFMIDSRYLQALETFWFTMQETKSLTGLTIVVMTTDHELSDDPFIQAICDDVIQIPDEAMTHYKKVKHGAVPDWRVQDEDSAFYFNKFHIFLENRYGRLFYFDVDMLCLKNIDGLIEISRHQDFSASNTFAGKAFKKEDGSLKSQDDIFKIVSKAIPALPKNLRTREGGGLNSGVLCLGGSALSRHTWLQLVKMAQTEDFAGDQNVVASLIHRDAKMKFKYLPQSYNVPRRMIDQLNIEQFFMLREDIHILHYNAGPPWKNGKKNSFVDFIWWDTFRRSRQTIADIRADKRAS